MEATAVRYINEVTSDIPSGESAFGDICDVLSDVCFVEPIEEIRTQAGLILPGAEKQQRYGTVVAAGPGRTYETGHFEPNPVKRGQVVIFGKFASGGEPLQFKGKTYILCRAGDLVAIMKPGAPQIEECR